MPSPSSATTKSSRQGTADHWKPENPWFNSLRMALRGKLNRNHVETDFGPGEVAFTSLEHTTAQVFLGAAPHTDLNFERWFVMLVLQAHPGSILHTSALKKAPKGRALKSVQDVPMREGEIFVFDAHRLHWVDSPVDVGLPSPAWRDDSSQWWARHFHQATVITGTELPSRPSREVAERQLLEFFSQYTPDCWHRATWQVPGSRPGSEPPRIKIKV